MRKGMISYILFLSMLLFLSIIIGGEFLLLVFVLSFLLFIMTMIMSIPAMLKTNVLIDCTTSIIRRNQEFKMKIKKNNPTLFPCGEICIHYTIQNESQKILAKKKIVFKDSIEEKITCSHCDCFTITIVSIQCSDMLNCIWKEHSINYVQTFYVFPLRIELKNDVKELFIQDDNVLQYHPYQKGNDYSEIYDLRNYRAEDSLKHIHWKVSMKKNELYVKEGSQPIAHHIYLALDLQHITMIDPILDYFYSLCLSLLERSINFEFLLPTNHYDENPFQVIQNDEQLLKLIKFILKNKDIFQQPISHSLTDHSYYVVNENGIEVIQ